MGIERILEPEVMDTPTEAQDYNGMDHSEVNRLFVQDFLAAGGPAQDILDLGTGTALIPIELCRHHESCRVMAVDAAVHMLELARYNVDSAGMLDRVQLQKVDAKALEFKDGMFDAVISNSIVHHIPQPIEVLSEAVRVTRDGGQLFFRDLLRPSSREQLQELVQTYAGEENAHSQRMFAESLHAALTLQEIRQLVASLGFDATAVQQTSDRHWTWSSTK